MNWRDRPRCDEAASWPLLKAHHAAHFAGANGFDLCAAFARDAGRASRLTFEAPFVLVDLSKNLVDDAALQLLVRLAQECGVEAHRDALFAGAAINQSERRAATHVQWRADANPTYATSVTHAAARTLEAMLAFAEEVRADPAITDVVNLGVGGSDLGPRLVVQALRASGHAQGGPRVHFVANMDGHDLGELLPRLVPAQTLFIVASKSFGTAETLRNAASARAWIEAARLAAARHFVAVSANAPAARAFGAGRCFEFDEGVGGRYSLWSPVGLAIALAIGRGGFEALLGGARAMDEHFRQAPLARNLPVLLALLDLWYREFHGFASRCVAPYHHGLRRLPAYLQQLEMESNGKRVDARGRALTCHGAAVVWGEVGSNAQHAFFQMLHQGTDVVPLEFVLVKTGTHGLPGHHAQLLVSALAQARALMVGQQGDAPERRLPGNRPSTILMLPHLSPASLGALLALYEHRTFALGSLLGINSFDQWGVELGKRLAGEIFAALQGGHLGNLDPSTRGLVERLRDSG